MAESGNSGMRKTILIAAIVMMGAVPGALAQTNPAPNDRYMVSPVEDGILRVDRKTGRVSICRKGRGDWTCELVPDDLRAMKRELDQLSVENLRLRSALAKYDPEAARQPAPELNVPNRDTGKNQLPTEEDVDKAMSLVERMMRRFMEAARDLNRDYGQPQN